jgi:MFS family permease
MVVLDISIVNVALATIKTDLRFSEASLQWVISAYAIIFGGFLLLGGRMVGLFARRVPRPAGSRRRALRARRAFLADDHVPRGA